MREGVGCVGGGGHQGRVEVEDGEAGLGGMGIGEGEGALGEAGARVA